MENTLENRIEYLKTQRGKLVAFHKFIEGKIEENLLTMGTLKSITSKGSCIIEDTYAIGEVTKIRVKVKENNVIAVKKNLSQITDNELFVIDLLVNKQTKEHNQAVKSGREIIALLTVLHKYPIRYIDNVMKAMVWLEKQNYCLPYFNGFKVEELLDYKWIIYTK